MKQPSPENPAMAEWANEQAQKVQRRPHKRTAVRQACNQLACGSDFGLRSLARQRIVGAVVKRTDAV
ncbi:MAG TPA: hypothetical protein VFO74_02120, partial [Pseudolabrys sp.]|nr:hypothetical protein [Pseudolabrys sp.]